MKRIKTVIILLIVVIGLLSSINHPAYQLYSNKGKLADYGKMIKDLAKSNMVFFGEHHTNPICHWLQLEMSQSFYEVKGQNLFLGAEMFENGNQLVIDEYLKNFYPEDKMIPEMTQLWGNYKTDYQPLVDFAKEKELRFIATNIPRRYASMIYKKGIDVLDELSPEAREMISPDLKKHFDPTVKGYAEMADQMEGHIPTNMLNIQTAQAAKDATMAHFVLKNYKKGDFLFHFEGTYHSDYSQGIIWWVNKINPGLKIKSITTVSQTEWSEMTVEQKETIADYIIVVADNMTQTK